MPTEPLILRCMDVPDLPEGTVAEPLSTGAMYRRLLASSAQGAPAYTCRGRLGAWMDSIIDHLQALRGAPEEVQAEVRASILDAMAALKDHQRAQLRHDLRSGVDVFSRRHALFVLHPELMERLASELEHDLPALQAQRTTHAKNLRAALRSYAWRVWYLAASSAAVLLCSAHYGVYYHILPPVQGMLMAVDSFFLLIAFSALCLTLVALFDVQREGAGLAALGARFFLWITPLPSVVAVRLFGAYKRYRLAAKKLHGRERQARHLRALLSNPPDITLEDGPPIMGVFQKLQTMFPHVMSQMQQQGRAGPRWSVAWCHLLCNALAALEASVSATPDNPSRCLLGHLQLFLVLQTMFATKEVLLWLQRSSRFLRELSPELWGPILRTPDFHSPFRDVNNVMCCRRVRGVKQCRSIMLLVWDFFASLRCPISRHPKEVLNALLRVVLGREVLVSDQVQTVFDVFVDVREDEALRTIVFDVFQERCVPALLNATVERIARERERTATRLPWLEPTASPDVVHHFWSQLPYHLDNPASLQVRYRDVSGRPFPEGFIDCLQHPWIRYILLLRLRWDICNISLGGNARRPPAATINVLRLNTRPIHFYQFSEKGVLSMALASITSFCTTQMCRMRTGGVDQAVALWHTWLLLRSMWHVATSVFPSTSAAVQRFVRPVRAWCARELPTIVRALLVDRRERYRTLEGRRSYREAFRFVDSLLVDESISSLGSCSYLHKVWWRFDVERAGLPSLREPDDRMDAAYRSCDEGRPANPVALSQAFEQYLGLGGSKPLPSDCVRDVRRATSSTVYMALGMALQRTTPCSWKQRDGFWSRDDDHPPSDTPYPPQVLAPYQEALLPALFGPRHA